MDPAAAQPRGDADRTPHDHSHVVAPSAPPLADEVMEEIAAVAAPPTTEEGTATATDQDTVVLALVSEGNGDACAHHTAAPVLHDITVPASELNMEEADQHPTQPAAVKQEEGECLVGRYISHTAADDTSTIRLGKVASYDSTTGVYSVVYENGHSEELGHHQLRDLLITDENGASGMKFSCRKRKLDLVVSSGTATSLNGPPTTRHKVDPCEIPARPDASQQTGSGSDVSEDVESSSNSSDSTKELAALPVQGPELPPSSGDIDVPVESISYLFSVYNFLRSFSVQLFLSPFGMDDFVASINCSVQSTLFDAVHVSLLQALRRHLETKSSEGSELASNCFKYLDWSLLDALTWPTLLLEYLYVMGCIKSLGGKSFGRTLLALEYYKLPITMKLRVLQILCDHAIDSEELKTELEAREAYNEELEYEMDSCNISEAGSRVVLTRPSRASACKNIEDSQNLDAVPNVKNPEAVVANASLDGNSDDCRICGMDGTLVCCDGCPWAYHSRCIGLNKAFLPHGLWFCPECVVNKLGPTSSRIERGARGAQMFGIDMCGRLFLGSCNYLLVTGTSSNAESYTSYYNQYDVVKVIQVLAFSDAYTDICRRITEYWPHLLDVFQNERSKTVQDTDASYALQSNMSLSVTPREAVDGSVSTILKDAGESKTTVLSQVDVQHTFVANQSTVCSADQLDEQKCMVTTVDVGTEKNTLQTPSAQNDVHTTPINGAFGSSVSHQNGSMVAGFSNITNAQPAYALIRTDLSASFSGMKDNGMSREDIGSTISVKAGSFCASQNKHPFGNVIGVKAAKLSSFKPQAYMNLYNRGNIAASAAANLAVLTAEEGKVAASQLITNPRKKMAADSALQLKAFSSATAQFVWPCTEKKVMEPPRDRCGWCLACKSSAIGNKKACFLNVASLNASKGSARVLSTMHVIKSSESHFPSIAAYLSHMEESLCGLLVGSLQDMQQRQRWHKQLQEASNCRTIIPLLLELESNIRGIAFSASWLKLMDDWPVKSSGVSAGPSRSAAYQKRGTGGRRGRKRLLAFDSATVTDDDKSWKEVNWWNGGNISKCILQRGVLPSSAVRKAARQGGKRKIAGLSYHETSSFPRRTRQFAWRACVGLSHNSSQLALQVRYLDAHIKWKEFVPPDQIPSDGKGSEADHSALRNAVVCDKKVVDGNIRYALKFSNQKHLPVRVTKNILEAEDNQDENGKLWFSENHIPLYLVRDFEQKGGVSSSPSPGMIISNSFTNFYQRRVKATIGDIFFYLFHKGDVYSCSSCKKDVAFRDVAKCSSCQGNCHKECTSGSVGSKGGNTAPNLICKLCFQKRNLIHNKTNANYALTQQKSNGQLPVTAPKIIFTVRSSHSSEQAMNVESQLEAKVQAQPVAKVETQPTKVETHTILKVETQPTPKLEPGPVTNVATQNIAGVQVQPKAKTKKAKPEKPKKPKKVQVITYFGLVWKKNKTDISGEDFRANDVILKSKDGIGSSIKPDCCLCNKPYSPDFMYVRCERCKKWFHGDALQLEEERISEVVQYRCCRCRRRAIPQCPHSDDYREPEPEVNEETATMSSQSTMLSGEETFAIADQDPLLASYGIVEPIREETMNADLSMNMANLMQGNNQKLSIRRAQVKNYEYLDQAGTSVNGYYVQNQPPGDANINFSHVNEFSLSETDGVDASELLGWDFTQGNGYNGGSDHGANSQWNDTSGGSFVAEEYEPQTYFSFTELLEADDTQFDNTFRMSTGLQDDGNFTGSFDQQGASFDELPFMVEDESSNMHFPANDRSIDELVCHKCTNPQPPPDLKCSSCGLRVHYQCSPWHESEQSADSANWRCGTCREWQ